LLVYFYFYRNSGLHKYIWKNNIIYMSTMSTSTRCHMNNSRTHSDITALSSLISVWMLFVSCTMVDLLTYLLIKNKKKKYCNGVKSTWKVMTSFKIFPQKSLFNSLHNGPKILTAQKLHQILNMHGCNDFSEIIGEFLGLNSDNVKWVSSLKVILPKKSASCSNNQLPLL